MPTAALGDTALTYTRPAFVRLGTPLARRPPLDSGNQHSTISARRPIHIVYYGLIGPLPGGCRIKIYVDMHYVYVLYPTYIRFC